MSTFLKFNKKKENDSTPLSDIEPKDGNVYFYDNEIYLDESSERNQYGITVKQNEATSTHPSDARPLLFTKHTVSIDSNIQSAIGILNSGETDIVEYNSKVLLYPNTNTISLNNLIIGEGQANISYNQEENKIVFSKGIKTDNLNVTNDSLLEGNLNVQEDINVKKNVNIAGNLYATNVNSIHYVVGNSSDEVGIWTATCNTIDSCYDGLTIAYRVTVSGGSANTTLTINESLGPYYIKTLKGNLTTQAQVGTIIHLTYYNGAWYWGNNTPSSINASGNKMYLLGSQIPGETNTTTNISASVFINDDNSLNSVGLKTSGNILISKDDVDTQEKYPSLQWGTFNSITPFMGYAADKSDGTFLLMSLQSGRNYTDGLAIDATEKKLCWLGTEVATVDSIVAQATKAGSLVAKPVITIGHTGKQFTGAEHDISWSTQEILNNDILTDAITLDCQGNGGEINLTSSTKDASNLGINMQLNSASLSMKTNKITIKDTVQKNATDAPIENKTQINSNGIYLNYNGKTSQIEGNEFSGNAATATTASKLSNTSQIGSSTNPVYFSSDGTPQASGYTMVTTDSNQTISGVKTFSNQVNITNTTNSTNIYNGALIVSGGIGCQGNIYGNAVYGAVFNDYAEYRKSNELKPGLCICERGNGELFISKDRLEPGANIISDTFGFAIGETNECKTPIAVSGRVLAYPYENIKEYKPGDAVCSGPNGTISKMTRKEIREYPERIIGTVSEIPTYEIWGTNKVQVDGRIWIKVK